MKPFLSGFVAVVVIAIATHSATAFGGPLHGPQINVQQIAGRAATTHTVYVRGGEHTTIELRSGDNADLEFLVYDEYGEQLAIETSRSDGQSTTLFVPHSQNLEIVIWNGSNVETAYSLYIW